MTEQTTDAQLGLYMQVYHSLGADIKALEAKAKELSVKQDKIKGAIHDTMRDKGLLSVKTPFGLAVVSQTNSFGSSDITELRHWIVQNNCPELLVAKLHQANTVAWLAENPDNPPPGLTSFNKQTLSIKHVKSN